MYDFKKHWAEAVTETAPSELQAQNLKIKILEKHVLLFWLTFVCHQVRKKLCLLHYMHQDTKNI